MEEKLKRLLIDSPLIIDGAMGTMIQTKCLSESDYAGQKWKNHEKSLKGNNDLLTLTQPKIIEDIHQTYIDAGANIIETNTFNANAISQSDYLMEEFVYQMNFEAGKLARRLVEKNCEKDLFVAGSIGPTNRTLSISPKVDEPDFRNVEWMELACAYQEQVVALIDSGVDMLFVETIFDTANAKAAIFAIEGVFNNIDFRETEILEKRFPYNFHQCERIPLFISVTIIDNSGRTLSGQNIDAFVTSVIHAKPFAMGMNCALGPRQMENFLRQLKTVVPKSIYMFCYPNAGLPNELGEYDMTPEEFGECVYKWLHEGIVHMIGGCCGCRPEHIKVLDDIRNELREKNIWREIDTFSEQKHEKDDEKYLKLSGLLVQKIGHDLNFCNIGERCNVAGSRMFARLLREEKYDDILKMARRQIEDGAQIIDINVDDGMIDGKRTMRKLLNLMQSEPNISEVPFCIDSSIFEVIEEGLRCCQGKCLVNSISLKEGEEEFLKKANRIRMYGCAVIAIAFDGQGQAVSVERKLKICKKSYDLLIENGWNGNDIVFDPNILTISTGMEEHDDYARAFLEALKLIKNECPLAKISGGVSNLSFSFRGLGVVREALNAIFLSYAIPAGLDMGIVNAGRLPIVTEINGQLSDICRRLIMNTDNRATEDLLAYATNEKSENGPKTERRYEWRIEKSVEDRINYSLLHGVDEFVIEDAEECLNCGRYGKPLDVIQGPLMNAMGIIGDLFGEGKLFLPQVIKSARVMKKAVAHLVKEMQSTTNDVNDIRYSGTVVIATVKGDVHDIGKNIVAVVLRCNNYNVIDLGIMTSCEKIIEAIDKYRPDILGLSGLITPSLMEMQFVASELERLNIKIPLIIGGATTSKKHTAIKIARKRKWPVVHVLDAAKSINVCSELLNGETVNEYLNEINEEYSDIRNNYFDHLTTHEYYSLEEARSRRYRLSQSSPIIKPSSPLEKTINLSGNIETIRKFIDWKQFFSIWQLRGRYPNSDYPRIFNDKRVGSEAKKLFDEAERMLDNISSKLEAKALFTFWKCRQSINCIDDIELIDENDGKVIETFNCLRQMEKRDDEKNCFCLSDFVASEKDESRYIGAFVATIHGAQELAEKYEKEELDDYKSIMVKALADRLAEAFAEFLHFKVRTEYWPFECLKEEPENFKNLLKLKMKGIRPAFGYPTQPDHSEKLKLWKLLDVEKRINVQLSSTYSMIPAASVSGLLFNEESQYFSLGRITEEQVKSYGKRKNDNLENIEHSLSCHLSYK
ncbi:hypothetical protein SNEBB_003729 [Seison nebaliae]|nr:hypothetical protein SNEBB_003729 [Seison nebaliae]